jgi:hypothetical protein
VSPEQCSVLALAVKLELLRSMNHRELTVSSLASTGANIARRSVLDPRGKHLGKRGIFTCRVANMGEGEYMPSGSRARLHAQSRIYYLAAKYATRRAYVPYVAD